MRRPDRVDPTDLEILRALADRPGGPADAEDLAAALRIASARVPVRLRSLVTLGYAAGRPGGKGRGDGYSLTDRGLEEVRRRRPARSAAPPPPTDHATGREADCGDR